MTAWNQRLHSRPKCSFPIMMHACTYLGCLQLNVLPEHVCRLNAIAYTYRLHRSVSRVFLSYNISWKIVSLTDTSCYYNYNFWKLRPDQDLAWFQIRAKTGPIWFGWAPARCQSRPWWEGKREGGCDLLFRFGMCFIAADENNISRLMNPSAQG